ncbi:MAG: hypothetical protein OXR73_37405, partial [Myxococcales bacterium]|nr:hypothetical protein [Myxococcales bacterium]
MSRVRTHFECSACGTTSPKWLGRCAGCGGWNTLAEVRARRAAVPA